MDKIAYSMYMISFGTLLWCGANTIQKGNYKDALFYLLMVSLIAIGAITPPEDKTFKIIHKIVLLIFCVATFYLMYLLH